MWLNKASAYGVLAVVYIAQHENEGPIQSRSIADAANIPIEYLSKVLQLLVRGQVIVSERGRRGGFQLRRAPDRITFSEIVEAIQGPIGIDHESGIDSDNPHGAGNYLARICSEMSKNAINVLRQATIGSVLQNMRSSRPAPCK